MAIDLSNFTENECTNTHDPHKCINSYANSSDSSGIPVIYVPLSRINERDKTNLAIIIYDNGANGYVPDDSISQDNIELISNSEIGYAGRFVNLLLYLFKSYLLKFIKTHPTIAYSILYLVLTLIQLKGLSFVKPICSWIGHSLKESLKDSSKYYVDKHSPRLIQWAAMAGCNIDKSNVTKVVEYIIDKSFETLDTIITNYVYFLN